MVGRRALSVISFFTAMILPVQTAWSSDEEVVGSIYPADIVAAATPSKSTQSKNAEKSQLLEPGVYSDPELAKALGAAAYILSGAGLDKDFRSAIRMAVGRHPAYHQQISAMEEAYAGQKSARSALYPQLSTSLSGDYVLKRNFDAGTDNVVESLRPREQFTAGISASQLVYDGGTTFQRIKSARARHAEFENSIGARINDLSYSALAAYHDLMTHQALLLLGDGVIKRHEAILNDVKERERLGAGSHADVTRAQARLASTRARVEEIRESERLADIRFQEFFRNAPGVLSRPSFDALIVNSREEASGLALQRSPELAIAAARADASQADYKAAKGSRLPEVRVSVDAVKFDVFDGSDDFDVRAGVNLNYNIFGGGARAAEITQAGSRAKQARFGAEQVRQQTARDAAMAFERREGATLRLAALKDALIAQNTTRHLVLERYRVARGELIDVLQSENDYFEAGVAFLTGLANRDMATYALMEHTGDLIRFFSPTEEYADVLGGGVDE